MTRIWDVCGRLSPIFFESIGFRSELGAWVLRKLTTTSDTEPQVTEIADTC